MKTNRIPVFSVVVLGVLLVGVATVVLAHHSMSAKYDAGRTITIEGTLTEVAWGNPHSWLFLDGKPVDQPNAAVKNWIIEAPSPSRMVRMGWLKDTIKAGYKAKITGHPQRNGKPGLALQSINDDHGHAFGEGVRLPNAVAGPSLFEP